MSRIGFRPYGPLAYIVIASAVIGIGLGGLSWVARGVVIQEQQAGTADQYTVTGVPPTLHRDAIGSTWICPGGLIAQPPFADAIGSDAGNWVCAEKVAGRPAGVTTRVVGPTLADIGLAVLGAIGAYLVLAAAYLSGRALGRGT